MARILLTHGYFLAEDEKERQIMKPYPPLGLLYLSAWLKRAGFSVEVFDSTFGERAALRERFAAIHRTLAVGHEGRVIEALMPYLCGHAPSADPRASVPVRAALRG